MSAATGKFLNLLVRAGRAEPGPDGHFVLCRDARQHLMSPQDAHALAAKGVLAISGGALVATPHTREFVRRRAATAGKTHPPAAETVSPDAPMRNLGESPLGRLAGRPGKPGFLRPHQLQAGLRFTRLFERASLRRRVTLSYAPERAGTDKYCRPAHLDISEMSMDARKRIDAVYAALPHECADLIMDVCGFEKGLQQIEIERRWPRRSAKLVLRIALEQLAHHFGLSQTATGAQRRGLSTWRPDEARPMALDGDPEL